MKHETRLAANFAAKLFLDGGRALMRLFLAIICLIVVLSLSGCGGTSEPTDTATLAKCYATEFGTVPPSGVTNLRAKQVVVGDAGGAWLRFEVDSNIVSQIISNRFVPSDRTSFSIYSSPSGNTPGWWKPEADSLTAFYINNQWRPGSNSSIAVLAHDAAHRVIYFHHGISF